MKTHGLSIILGLALLVSGNTAFAQSRASVMSVVTNQTASVNTAVSVIANSSTGSTSVSVITSTSSTALSLPNPPLFMPVRRICNAITGNLRIGSRGEAVRQLQMFLNQDSDTRVSISGVGSVGNESTYFGPATHRAIVKFQQKHSADILTPAGLRAGNGFVGALTRARIMRLCDGQQTSGVVYSVTTDKTTYSPQDVITMTITAKNTSTSTKQLTFTHGCEASYSLGNYEYLAVRLCIQVYSQMNITPGETKTWTLTHDLKADPIRAGTYTLVGKVVNNGEARTSITITGSSSSSNITVTSPRSADVWVQGTTQTIQWQTPNVTYIQAPRYDIYVAHEIPACAREDAVIRCLMAVPAPFVIAKNVIGSAGTSTYDWRVGYISQSMAPHAGLMQPLAGRYQIRVCDAGSVSNCNQSAVFTIMTSTTQ